MRPKEGPVTSKRFDPLLLLLPVSLAALNVAIGLGVGYVMNFGGWWAIGLGGLEVIIGVLAGVNLYLILK